jgi:hypothetical protein
LPGCHNHARLVFQADEDVNFVRQHEAHGLARQHGLIDRRDLVRQRFHIRGVDRHHGIEQERQVDALGFNGEFEGFAIPVE